MKDTLFTLAQKVVDVKNRYELKEITNKLDELIDCSVPVTIPTDEEIDKLPEGKLSDVVARLWAQIGDYVDSLEQE